MATPTKAKKKKKSVDLERIEVATAREIEKRRRRPKPTAEKPTQATRKKRKLAQGVPRPEGMSSEELKELDADDPRLKNPQGRPRKARGDHWKEAVRANNSKRKNARRAKVRKRDAVVAQRAEEVGIVPIRGSEGDVEASMIASGEIDMDGWDVEECIRGYRRSRSGDFGPPPKMIPREVQQEAFRRLLKHGSRKLASAYVRAIENLVIIAQDPEVRPRERLTAITEIMNRVGGRVPERIAVSADSPWQDMLVDAILPIGGDENGATAPIYLSPTVDGHYAMSGDEDSEPEATGALPAGKSSPDNKKNGSKGSKEKRSREQVMKEWEE